MSEIPLDQICPGCGDLIEPGSGACGDCARDEMRGLEVECNRLGRTIAERDATIETLRAVVEAEVWMHAACLTFAEGYSLDDERYGDGKLLRDSPAMQKVRELRRGYDRLEAERDALRDVVDAARDIAACLSEDRFPVFRDALRALDAAEEPRPLSPALRAEAERDAWATAAGLACGQRDALRAVVERFLAHWHEGDDDGVNAAIDALSEPMPTSEEADAILRDHGLDPDEVGRRGAEFVASMRKRTTKEEAGDE